MSGECPDCGHSAQGCECEYREDMRDAKKRLVTLLNSRHYYSTYEEHCSQMADAILAAGWRPPEDKDEVKEHVRRFLVSAMLEAERLGWDWGATNHGSSLDVSSAVRKSFRGEGEV